MTEPKSIRFAWEHALRDPDQRPAPLTSTDIAVALMIATWAFTPWELRQEDLAEASGFTPRTVGRAVDRLVKLGLITAERTSRRAPTRYELRAPSEWRTSFGTQAPSGERGSGLSAEPHAASAEPDDTESRTRFASSETLRPTETTSSPHPSGDRNKVLDEPQAGGGGGVQESGRLTPPAVRAYELVTVALDVTDLRGEAVELLASKVDDHGWSPAQVATVAAGDLPDEVHDATRFVRARLAAETAAPTVGRPPRGSAWERIEDPGDGWAPRPRIEGAPDCPQDGCPHQLIQEADGFGWCNDHGWEPLPDRAAAS